MSRRFLYSSLSLSLFIALLSFSCDSTEGAGSGGIEPVISAPQIIEGFMCAGIFENKPVGIDNDFWLDDPVYIWLTWDNMIGAHEIKILWVDPNEKLYEKKQSYESKEGKLTTYFWLDTTSSATPGEWIAEVYLDGLFVRSYSFWLNSMN